MNIQSNNASPHDLGERSEIEKTKKYYRFRLKRSQDRNNLPCYIGPEYGSIIRTIERFSLITHLIFLYRRRKVSKKEYTELSLLGNAAILEQLRRKQLLSELEN